MKKIAFVVSSIEVCFSDMNNKRGGNVLIGNLIAQLIENPDIEFDIYCWGDKHDIKGVRKIFNCYAANNDDYMSQVNKLINAETYDNIVYLDTSTNTLIQASSHLHRCSLKRNFLTRILSFFLKREKIKNQRYLFSGNYKKIFVVSESLKKDYSKNYNLPEDKFVVIYPGTKTIDDVKKQDTDIITFGISAGSNANKGAVKFINALRCIKTKGYNVKALMICPRYKKMWHIRVLIKLFNLSDNIEILGFQTDMNKFYSRLDAIVMPSMYEGFGLVALEGAANKVVPVVSCNSGVSEIINNNVNGFIFDIRNNPIKNLTDTMINVADLYNSHKLKEIQENAYSLAKEYTWEKFAQKFYEEA